MADQRLHAVCITILNCKGSLIWRRKWSTLEKPVIYCAEAYVLWSDTPCNITTFCTYYYDSVRFGTVHDRTEQDTPLI